MADLDSWDAEDFEPELPSKQASDDKWAGEDEDDVKGSWEDGEEEGASLKVAQPENQAYQRPKKKPLAERIAEKEAEQKKKEEERRAKQREERRELSQMTVEERQAEKERVKKLKAQENLSLAKGLFD